MSGPLAAKNNNNSKELELTVSVDMQFSVSFVSAVTFFVIILYCCRHGCHLLHVVDTLCSV